MSPERPIALSLGDPAGIGPEIIVKAWRALAGVGPAFFVIGDRAAVARAAGDQVPVRLVTTAAEASSVFADALPVMDLPLPGPVTVGSPSPSSAGAVISWIERGARLAMTGDVSALVTAPIAKAPLYEAGFSFPGHTEFLGEIAGAGEDPVMMLTSGDLRCALVTIHEPLSAVSSRVTRKAIVDAGRTTARALAVDFGVAAPRLAVAGLNPHAGESGSIGREETDVIAPAVATLRAEGFDARGPYPADSLFHAEARRDYDGVLCMYHDQALIPVKMLDFWGGVNVTLGLSIVRTSPDHGVAYDIAGKGVARPDSLVAALRLADQIAGRRAAA